jgi:hypothetical protein
MNEQIKELAGLAKFLVEESIHKQISASAELNALAEKFAELLVKECVAIMASECLTQGVEGAIISTYEHFGVE